MFNDVRYKVCSKWFSYKKNEALGHVIMWKWSMKFDSSPMILVKEIFFYKNL